VTEKGAGMGYSIVNADEIEPGGRGPDGLSFVSVGVKPGAYVARGPF
jgi:hypothetical protein